MRIVRVRAQHPRDQEVSMLASEKGENLSVLRHWIKSNCEGTDRRDIVWNQNALCGVLPDAHPRTRARVVNLSTGREIVDEVLTRLAF